MPLRRALDLFFKREAFGGMLLMASAVATLWVANSAPNPMYDSFLNAAFSVTLNG